jgi:methyl-accepting chemotaxis protein
MVALALGAFAYVRLVTIRNHSDEITKQSLPAMEMVYQVQKNAKDQVQLVYKHVGSGDPADMARLEADLAAGSADNAKLYDQLDKLVTSEQGRALLEKVKTARMENNRVRDQVVASSRQGTNKSQAYGLARSQFDPVNTQYLATLDSLIDSIRTDTDDASRTIQAAVQSSQMGILSGLGLATLAGIGIALLIIRGTGKILNRVTGALSDGSNQVVSAAAQVSSSSQSLAEGANEQAASLEETSDQAQRG